jgi:ferric-dicitrate binding protein FerR (iron transport regulator)
VKRSKRELDEMLDDLNAEIRSEELANSVVAGASERVWQRLNGEDASVGAISAITAGSARPVEHLRSCGDFQSLIPSYLAGGLAAARTLLFEDHISECVPCRRALKEARHGSHTGRRLAIQHEKLARPTRLDSRPGGRQMLRWGLAAAAVLAIGLLSWPIWQRVTKNHGLLNGVVEAAEGEVYRVTDSRTELLRAGEKVLAGERLRTARGGRALVRLTDGSSVELGERGEFGFASNVDGPMLKLDRGAVIIEATSTSPNRLIVMTDESRVAAAGTIFAVNHGTKGDRLSVVDGQISLDQTGQQNRTQTLKPGDQLTTHVSIEKVPISQEISWSRNSARYQKMLDQVASLREQIDQQVSLPGNRYTTQLLDLMPERTALYLGLPNISATLAKANQLLTENIEKSPELKAWWENERSATGGQSNRRGIDQALAFARDFGSYLGDEITFGAEIDPQRKAQGDFLLIADLRDAAGLRNFIEKKLAAAGADSAAVVLVDDPRTYVAPAANAGAEDRIYVWLGPDLLAASPRAAALQRLAGRLDSPATRAFTTNPFHEKIAAIYREGAGLLIAADLERLIVPALEADKNSADDTAFARQIGFDNLRYFIVEVKEKEGRPYNRAVVSFRKNDHGITSWLATPGPMGALEFISPNASLVSAFVVREPMAIVDDLFATIRSTNPKSWDALVAFQSGKGIDLRQDLAAPLGSEYALAIDGPILPIPSWKAIFEVDDPQRLQQTIELIVGMLDQQIKADGKLGLALTKEVDGEKTFYQIKSLDFGLEADYIFAHGYLIAGPSRTLVENALKYRDGGNSILQSAKFKATLPADKQPNFSAIVYQDLGTVTKTLGKLAGDKGATINALLNGKAGLAYVYALDDQMVFSVNSEDGPLGISPSDFLALPGATGLGAILNRK